LTGEVAGPIRVRDIVTQSTHTIARADCGLGCRCAIEIVKSEGE
jgi:hypothetical protein